MWLSPSPRLGKNSSLGLLCLVEGEEGTGVQSGLLESSVLMLSVTPAPRPLFPTLLGVKTGAGYRMLGSHKPLCQTMETQVSSKRLS